MEKNAQYGRAQVMKKVLVCVLCICLMLPLAACGLTETADAAKDGIRESELDSIARGDEEETEMNDRIDIEVNGQVRTAILSDNRSAQAFLELLEEGPITVAMHDYGGFEKVGDLGTSLPRSDEPITTTPGDVILYLGNSVTIYYDVNSWNFTLLGHIEDATGENMREFLGNGDATVTFSQHIQQPD